MIFDGVSNDTQIVLNLKHNQFISLRKEISFLRFKLS
jgi:hypothetical protein